jgi:hypothetical protein
LLPRTKKLIIALAAVAALTAISAPLVLAAADTDDNIAPASTTVKASLLTGSNAVFTGTVSGVAVTSTCKVSTTAFKTPAHGLGPVTTSNPVFSSCTDSLGGTDTVKTNSTNGTWKATFLDVANDEAKEVAGDRLKLTIPKAGATIVSSVLPTCKITVAPSAAANAIAKYNDVNRLGFAKAPIPTSGTGCTTSATGSYSANYTLTPGIHDAS